MKKLNKISLYNLSQAELAKREENLLRGGEYTCACAVGAVCQCSTDYEEGEKEYYTDPVTMYVEENNFNAQVTLTVKA